MRDNLFYHRLHLVHLNGVYNKVLGLVAIFVGGLFKAARRFLDTVIKNVGEAQQHGRSDVAQGELVHHVAQIDLCVVFARGDIHVALLVDVKIRGAPTVDVV